MTDEPLSEVRMHNTPDSDISIEPVGTQPHIIYHVDWREMGQPTPKMFHDVSDAQVTLATLGNYIEDESVEDAYDDAMKAINTLLREMTESRADDLDGDRSKGDLYMGNLQELPEVEREVEQR